MPARSLETQAHFHRWIHTPFWGEILLPIQDKFHPYSLSEPLKPSLRAYDLGVGRRKI